MMKMQIVLTLNCVALVITQIYGCHPSCTCVGDTVSCRNRGLYAVPHFSTHDFDNIRVLDLSYNSISELPDKAFLNVHLNTLLLNNNKIRWISNDSFHGLTNEIRHLDLSNNELLTLPDALGTLGYLESLNVSNNNQGSDNLDLTDSVIKALGDTLKEFTFGSLQQRKWPTTLYHLQDLHRLEVTSLHPELTILPPTGFHGFEPTLFELSIHNTNLMAVPFGVSNLRNLHTLNYDYNPNTGDQGILLQSFPTSNSSKLTTLSMKGDSLTVFPLVLQYLKHLEKLSIDDNPLDFFSDDSVEGLHSLREITIRNCSLDRVPAALSTIQNLKEIDFSFNAIKTVEQKDLTGFSGITKLVLSNMPLQYVSRDSLVPLYAIKELVMNNTDLTEVPLAVNFTNSLEKISVGQNRIECMCENMVWLLYKVMNCNYKYGHPRFQVIGDCDTIHTTVEDYLINYVPRCPEYKELCDIMPYG